MNNTSSLAAHENNSFINSTLKQYDAYIYGLARKAIPQHLGYTIGNESEFSLEIDELAQRSRIKLWRALQKQPITSLKAYIRRIVHNECIDLARQRQPHIPLPLNEEGELSLGDVLFITDRESKDPAGIVEQRERLRERITNLLDVIENCLPKRQRQAILCSLKEHIDDIDQLGDRLAERQIDLAAVQCSVEQKEQLTLRVSRSLARRTIAQCLDIDLSYYKRARIVV